MNQTPPLRSLDQVLVDLGALRDRDELGAWLVETMANRPDVLWAALWQNASAGATVLTGESNWHPWNRAGIAVVTPTIDRNGLPLGAHAITEGDAAGKTYWHNDLSASSLSWARLPGVRGIAFQPIVGPSSDRRFEAVLIVLASVAFVGEGVAWLKTLAAHMTRALERASFIGGSVSGTETFLTEEQMRDFERRNLVAALQASEGKIYGDDGAAARLGLRPTTLVSRLSKYGVDRSSRDGY